jgi:hypothetical protein
MNFKEPEIFFENEIDPKEVISRKSLVLETRSGIAIAAINWESSPSAPI